MAIIKAKLTAAERRAGVDLRDVLRPLDPKRSKPSKPSKPMKLDDKLAAADRLLDEMLRHPLGVRARADRLVDARLLINASRKEAKELREGAIKLARCAVFTLQANGKPGIGSGLVMSETKGGKRTVERWDKQYVEALASIGIEIVDKPPASRKR